MMPAVTSAIIKGTDEFELLYTTSVKEQTNKNKRVTSLLIVMNMMASRTLVTNSVTSNHGYCHILKNSIFRSSQLTTNIYYQYLTKIKTKIHVPLCLI